METHENENGVSRLFIVVFVVHTPQKMYCTIQTIVVSIYLPAAHSVPSPIPPFPPPCPVGQGWTSPPCGTFSARPPRRSMGAAGWSRLSLRCVGGIHQSKAVVCHPMSGMSSITPFQSVKRLHRDLCGPRIPIFLHFSA